MDRSVQLRHGGVVMVDWVKRHRVLVLFGACALTLVLRLGLIFVRQTYLLSYETTDIGAIPYNLVAGDGYTYLGMESSYFGPAYTFLWAGLMVVFGREGGQLAVQIVQAAALSIAPIFVFLAARHFFNQTAAYLAALWFAFYPELLVLSSTMYSDSIVLALWCVLLGLYAVFMERQRPSYLLAVLFGMVIAVMTLAKGRMLLLSGWLMGLMLLHGLVTVWKERAQQRLRLTRQIVIPLLGGILALLLISPWIARNYAVHDKFMPTESTMGFNLWVGHNANATGTGKLNLGNTPLAGGEFNDEVTGSARFPRSDALQAQLAQCETEASCDDLYLEDALQVMAQDPAREIALSAKKVFYAWWFDPTSATAVHWLYRLPWIVTLVFFVVGAAYRLVVARRIDWLLWGVLVLTTLLQVLFFVVPRFRYPVYPIVFMFAGYAVALVLQRWMPRDDARRPEIAASQAVGVRDGV